MKCPLLSMAKADSSDCIKKDCAWWIEAHDLDDIPYIKCAVTGCAVMNYLLLAPNALMP